MTSITAQLLAGLTDNGDEGGGLSVVIDAKRELEALAALLVTSEGDIDREPLCVLLLGIERRLTAGLNLLRRAS